MTKLYKVVNSFDNDEKNRCVDIVEQNGRFRFQEWRREPEDLSGWILILDSLPIDYTSADEAVKASIDCVSWFDHQPKYKSRSTE